MNLEFEQRDGGLVVRLLDARLDTSSAWDLKARVRGSVEAGVRRLVLEMGHVEFVDSTGLSALLSVLKQLPEPGQLALAGCRPSVLQVLKLTRLDRVFAMHATAEEALAALREKAAGR